MTTTHEQMKERRVKSKLKSLLNEYAEKNGLTPKQLAKTIGLKTALSMNQKCWDGSFTEEELNTIQNMLGIEKHILHNMMSSARRKNRKPNYMRQFIQKYCKDNKITGQQFAEEKLDMSYNGLFIKLKRKNWTTNQLQHMAKVTGTPYDVLSKLAINQPVPMEDDGN